MHLIEMTGMSQTGERQRGYQGGKLMSLARKYKETPWGTSFISVWGLIKKINQTEIQSLNWENCGRITVIYVFKILVGRSFEGRSPITNTGVQVGIQCENMSEWQKLYKDLK